MTERTNEVPAEDGWIRWAGGECPVPSDANVEIWCRDEKKWASAPCTPSPAHKLRWKHAGLGGDIYAYRVVTA